MDELFNTQPKVTRYRPTVLGTRQFALLTIGYILELLPVPSLFRGQLELTANLITIFLNDHLILKIEINS